ncbi:hypothetical protein [Klebsiella quasipneumoniae]|uniref:hypothetical protein n=1 Tax=Klebsiella quasipneumoniae TaxID=1463165 RepID=UPI002948CFE0|nr:hypothetical protein [Klebsiella quasipneumoniae]MDV5693401.1 hypothetical protein [Klebsiella quasipneumoniae]
MDAWIGSMIGGVAGAVIGHATNHFVGWYKENKQSSPERKFICTELIFLLEDYANKCAEIANDYGEYTGDQGEAQPTTSPPELLDYSSIKGNWRSLSSDIMYRVCSLPAEQKGARKKLSVSWGLEAYPPDYKDYFEERQYQYSLLGLKAAYIAEDVRKQNRFPDSDLWDYVIPTMEKKVKSYGKKPLRRSDN